MASIKENTKNKNNFGDLDVDGKVVTQGINRDGVMM
jgi:hypothetical protein